MYDLLLSTADKRKNKIKTYNSSSEKKKNYCKILNILGILKKKTKKIFRLICLYAWILTLFLFLLVGFQYKKKLKFTTWKMSPRFNRVLDSKWNDKYNVVISNGLRTEWSLDLWSNQGL